MAHLAGQQLQAFMTGLDIACRPGTRLGWQLPWFCRCTVPGVSPSFGLSAPHALTCAERTSSHDMSAAHQDFFVHTCFERHSEAAQEERREDTIMSEVQLPAAVVTPY